MRRVLAGRAVLLLCIAHSLAAGVALAEAPQRERVYVPTVGFPLFVVDGVPKGGEFALYLIDSPEARDRFVATVLERVEHSSRNEEQARMLVRVLSVRDYRREYTYVVASPVEDGIAIDQPYHLAGERTLVFEARTDPKLKDSTLVYLRLYTVGRSEDVFRKYVDRAGKLQELLPCDLYVVPSDLP